MCTLSRQITTTELSWPNLTEKERAFLAKHSVSLRWSTTHQQWTIRQWAMQLEVSGCQMKDIPPLILARTLCVSLEKRTNWSYRHHRTTTISTSGHWCPRARGVISLSTSQLPSCVDTKTKFTPSDTTTTPTRWPLPVPSKPSSYGRHPIAKSWPCFPNWLMSNH